MGRTYWVYILTNHSGSLYVGVTNNIERRVYEHRLGQVNGYTKKYALKILIYLEETRSVVDAITREKEIKGWRRQKKLALIHELNPQWEDLAEDIVVDNLDVIPTPTSVIPTPTSVIPRPEGPRDLFGPGIDPSLRSG